MVLNLVFNRDPALPRYSPSRQCASLYRGGTQPIGSKGGSTLFAHLNCKLCKSNITPNPFARTQKNLLLSTDYVGFGAQPSKVKSGVICTSFTYLFFLFYFVRSALELKWTAGMTDDCTCKDFPCGNAKVGFSRTQERHGNLVTPTQLPTVRRPWL